MSVPILDDAYMQRRAARLRFESTLRSMTAWSKALNYVDAPGWDRVAEAKEMYVRGMIDVCDLERAVERECESSPQGLTG